MAFSFQEAFKKKLEEANSDYTICGVVTKEGVVYPLGSDTKVLSTIFELFTRPLIVEIAKEYGYEVKEPDVQNHYPDFTLFKKNDNKNRIAVDVKTTYVDKDSDSFGFTLGGYTSFIRGNGKKNIVYPFSEYSEHWVIGYVYKRIATKKSAESKTYKVNELEKITLPYENVQIFVQEKWRISSDKAGSGNTTNIGSINGKLADFEEGKTPFKSEEEFLDYWRNYERTAAEREGVFSNVSEYRIWKSKQK